jgi:hypothetical protein
MAEEDGNHETKGWAADLPGSEDERDQQPARTRTRTPTPKPARGKVSPPRRTLQPICRMTTRSWF